jgi:hypothetical protein
VFNAIYIDPEEIRQREMTPLLIGMTSLAIAVFGAREGRILRRSEFDDLYETINGKMENEHHMMDSAHVRMLTLDRIAPHQVTIAHAKVNEDELLRFRASQGFWKSGRAAAFYSYRQGTVLYFSNSQEAVLAKIVLDTPDRKRYVHHELNW